MARGYANISPTNAEDDTTPAVPAQFSYEFSSRPTPRTMADLHFHPPTQNRIPAVANTVRMNFQQSGGVSHALAREHLTPRCKQQLLPKYLASSVCNNFIERPTFPE
ncbi:hypothetical protein TNCV_3791161 [Trichonephila clavipes]|nr:hypothetical protein TNCV_3791161 [Trichonephila clavipes]